MKLNAVTTITGKKVMLIPYKKHHVPKYHKWMQRDDLREATASELLTEEQEYQMQQSWLADEDKCTFIILDKETLDRTKNEIEAMIGDVNLYLSCQEGTKIAECGIMIAEDSARGQGKGLEALLLMLNYGSEILRVDRFEAKISLSNTVSMKMFDKIGFKMVEKNDIFAEATFLRAVDEEWKQWLASEIGEYSISDYENDSGD